MPVPVAEVSPTMSGRVEMLARPAMLAPPLKATELANTLETPLPGVEPREPPRTR